MKNIIPFPGNKPQEYKDMVKLVFCIDCLKQRCPDISNKKDGVVAMLIPIVDESDNPHHAYITIKVVDLKNIFISRSASKFVDLAEYATIYSIEKGFEPKSDFMSEYFSKGRSESIRVLH